MDKEEELSAAKCRLIPATNFTLGFVIDQLNASATSPPQWNDLVLAHAQPNACRIETLAGKGYLSSVNRIIFKFANDNEVRVVLKVPTTNFMVALELDTTTLVDKQMEEEDIPKRLMKYHNQEVFFYTKIALHFSDTKFGAYLARIYAAKACESHTQLDTGFILMEDVGTRGKHFNFSSGQGLSFEQVSSIIGPLAEFHAHSLTMSREQLGAMNCATPVFEFEQKLKHLGEKLRKLPRKAGEFFRASSNSIYIDELLSSPKQYINYFNLGLCEKLGLPPTLTHGDLWCNNILFDTVDDRRISVILDWQFVHANTGLNDVVHLLLTSVEGELRRKHENDWLRLYFETFKHTLSADIRCPFMNFDHLKRVYLAHFYPGLIHQMIMLTTFLAQNEADPARNAECERMMAAFEDLVQLKNSEISVVGCSKPNGIVAAKENGFALQNHLQ